MVNPVSLELMALKLQCLTDTMIKCNLSGQMTLE
jgi:hypothetical protein